jgi:hypothetical protein
MAEVPNIFHARLPAGKISGEAIAILGQPVRTHAALTRGIAASQINLLDTADISEAAHVAQEIGDKNAQLTGSPNGPNHIPPVHPIINGIANISQATQRLAKGK